MTQTPHHNMARATASKPLSCTAGEGAERSEAGERLGCRCLLGVLDRSATKRLSPGVGVL